MSDRIDFTVFNPFVVCRVRLYVGEVSGALFVNSCLGSRVAALSTVLLSCTSLKNSTSFQHLRSLPKLMK